MTTSSGGSSWPRGRYYARNARRIAREAADEASEAMACETCGRPVPERHISKEERITNMSRMSDVIIEVQQAIMEKGPLRKPVCEVLDPIRAQYVWSLTEAQWQNLLQSLTSSASS